jgi:hypothetical protein
MLVPYDAKPFFGKKRVPFYDLQKLTGKKRGVL